MIFNPMTRTTSPPELQQQAPGPSCLPPKPGTVRQRLTLWQGVAAGNALEIDIDLHIFYQDPRRCRIRLSFSVSCRSFRALRLYLHTRELQALDERGKGTHRAFSCAEGVYQGDWDLNLSNESWLHGSPTESSM